MTDELILEDFLPYRLAVLSHTVSTKIAGVYDKRFGLTIPEWRVLAILGRFPGLSAVEVAERTMLDKVAVSRAVTKLIRSVSQQISGSPSGREPRESRGATHTFFSHWVDFKATIGNFRITFCAVAVIIVVDAPLGHFDAHQIALAQPLLGFRHGLLLH